MLARFALLLLVLPALLVACGQPAPEEPPVTQPTTKLGIPITKKYADLPELKDADVEKIVAAARKKNLGAPIRAMMQSRSHPLGIHYVEVSYDYHDTKDRIRRYHTSSYKGPEAADPKRFDCPEWDPDLEVTTEVCPAGRSFKAKEPVPETEIVRLLMAGSIDDALVVEIVDYMKGRHRSDEQLHAVEPKDDGYEVRTIRGKKLEGTVFTVKKVDGKWTHQQTGGWMS